MRHCSERLADRQIDVNTDLQIGRQTDRQTDRQMHGQTVRQTDKHGNTDRYEIKEGEGRMVKQVDVQIGQ